MENSIDREDPSRIERVVDRSWFLLERRRRAEGAGSAGTVVLRDGDCVVVSVEARAIGWPEGTLLFRLRSETTPCAGCVHRAITLATARAGRRLTAEDVRGMIRFAVSRCAAWGEDPVHARMATPQAEAADEPPVSRPPASRPSAEWRRNADLWLVL